MHERSRLVAIGLKERFMLKVDKNTTSGCWEWTASKFKSGYGQFSVLNYPMYAHRVSYCLFIGPIPKNLWMDHICLNPGCVNPEHLRPATISQNAMNQNIKKPTGHLKGISFHKKMNKWISNITVNNIKIHLGYFEKELDAHAAYCEAAIIYHGEFANFGGGSVLRSVPDGIGIRKDEVE
jgi:hypothetical protein